jgi:hypothetical protein
VKQVLQLQFAATQQAQEAAKAEQARGTHQARPGIVNITTQDANSFRKNEQQVSSQVSRDAPSRPEE